jgi:predicted nucleotidyltransferase
MHPAVADHREGIAVGCRRFGIRQLEVFGSAARSAGFDARHSDIDFLVEFDPQAGADLGTYFDAQAALEALLGRPVDLLERGALRNPYLLREIERERELVHAA